jgi:hypothetical protein
MHRLYCNLQNERYTDMDILEFSDLICKKLVVRSRRQHKRLAALTGTNLENTSVLERITDKDGRCRFSVTDNQTRRGRNVGKSMHLNCYICQKYLTPMGNTEYIQTTFRCSDCKMPLCKKDRSNSVIGREKSCLDEHITSKCKTVGCYGSDRQFMHFPRDKQVQLVRNQLSRRVRQTAV